MGTYFVLVISVPGWDGGSRLCRSLSLVHEREWLNSAVITT